jgi:hypothetical protein
MAGIGLPYEGSGTLSRSKCMDLVTHYGATRVLS